MTRARPTGLPGHGRPTAGGPGQSNIAMAAISAICIGVALMLAGAALTSRYSKLVSEPSARAQLSGRVTALLSR